MREVLQKLKNLACDGELVHRGRSFVLRSHFIRKIYRFTASRFFLGSAPLLSSRVRGHACRVYLKRQCEQHGRNTLIDVVKSQLPRLLQEPDVFATMATEIRKLADQVTLNKEVIPRVAREIEASVRLDEQQKLFGLLVLGAHDAAIRRLKHLPSLRSPDFIIGGAQKASTSWLKTVINAHPDVWMPSFEVHYFSNNPCSWTLEEYLGLFSISHAKVVGEKSTSYLGVISKIINTLPKTKIFLILRDPFDRLASQYFHVLRHGRHQGKNIQEFVAEDIENCLELVLYYRSLKDYLDRVNILFFEDIINRPKTVVREVMEVLGLSVSVIAMIFLVLPMVYRWESTKTAFLTQAGLRTIDSFVIKTEEGLRFLSEALEKSPLFGFGPAKATDRYLGDNQYSKYFYRYGMIGLIVWFGFWVSILWKAFIIWCHPKNSLQVAFSRALLCVVPGFLLACVGGAFLTLLKL